MKSKGIAYTLWLPSLLGVAGIQRIYIGKVGTGILWLLTAGLLGLGTLVDLFTLSSQVDLSNLKKGSHERT